MRLIVVFLRLKSESGAALVELAATLPLLILVLVSAIDFARVFYLSIGLTDAARAGAQYGAMDSARTSDFAGMQAAAANSGTSGVTTTATRSCECWTNAGVYSSTLAACSDTCASGSHPVTTVTVSASKTFTTIINFSAFFSGVPTSVPLTRSAKLRLAQ